jgi:hypothetical protein
MLTIFFDIKGILHKAFVLAGQTVNSAYYCEVLLRLCENVQRPLPELWRPNNWLVRHDNAFFSHFLFKQEIFDQNKRDCCPSPTLLFPVSPIEDKTERPPF